MRVHHFFLGRQFLRKEKIVVVLYFSTKKILSQYIFDIKLKTDQKIHIIYSMVALRTVGKIGHHYIGRSIHGYVLQFKDKNQITHNFILPFPCHPFRIYYYQCQYLHYIDIVLLMEMGPIFYDKILHTPKYIKEHRNCKIERIFFSKKINI